MDLSPLILLLSTIIPLWLIRLLTFSQAFQMVSNIVDPTKATRMLPSNKSFREISFPVLDCLGIERLMLFLTSTFQGSYPFRALKIHLTISAILQILRSFKPTPHLLSKQHHFHFMKCFLFLPFPLDHKNLLICF